MTNQIIVGSTATDWPQALYLHVPFCPTHCHYCDFAVTVGTANLIERYLDSLIQEIDLTPSLGQGLTTVYLGGGTPSLLTPKQLGRVLTHLEQHFGLGTDPEITLEVNPGTVDRTKLSEYRHLGVNRLSLGIQSFDQPTLQRLGRNHSVRDIYRTVEDLHQAGFTNYSVDLMFGLPEQSLGDWEDSLTQALSLGPSHVSAYDLILEPETPFGRRFRTGLAPLPSEDATIDMYLQLIERLQAAGYEHYEIASLAKPGHRSRHNQVYWHNQPYYGLGAGATGYIHHQRFERPRRLTDYFAWVKAGAQSQGPALIAAEELGETLMLGLRLVEGVDLGPLEVKFGTAAMGERRAAWAGVQQQNLVQEKDGQLRLQYPQGFLLANEVFAACL